MIEFDLKKICELEPALTQSVANEVNYGELFSGHFANQCFNFAGNNVKFEVVIVTGSGLNICGHALLCVNRFFYLHTVHIMAPPRFMNQSGYELYLRSNKKKELGRIQISVSEPKKVLEKLNLVTSEKWLWLAIWHNCYSFVEYVVEPGKLERQINYNSLFYQINCPRKHLIMDNLVRNLK